MALKLQSREIPLVNFRRVLPAFLGPEGEECFLEVDARAGGAINIAYVASGEALILRGQVMDRKMQKIEDADTYVKANHANVMNIIKGRFGALYDACVIEWRCNILDDGKPIVCDRATFLELTEVRVPEIAEAMTDLETEILEAGKAVAESDEGLLKN